MDKRTRGEVDDLWLIFERVMNPKTHKATRVRFQTSGRLGRGVITNLHVQ